MRHTKNTLFALSLILMLTFTACDKNAANGIDTPAVLQKTVGTAGDTYTSSGLTDAEGYQSVLTKTFTDTTEADYAELMEHYESASNGTDENGSLLYDWGRLIVTPASDYSSIAIAAYFK